MVLARDVVDTELLRILLLQTELRRLKGGSDGECSVVLGHSGGEKKTYIQE